MALNAMLWIVRTGALWQDLPERYGPWATFYSRFRLWKQIGVFDRLLAVLQEGADRERRRTGSCLMSMVLPSGRTGIRRA